MNLPNLRNPLIFTAIICLIGFVSLACKAPNFELSPENVSFGIDTLKYYIGGVIVVWMTYFLNIDKAKNAIKEEHEAKLNAAKKESEEEYKKKLTVAVSALVEDSCQFVTDCMEIIVDPIRDVEIRLDVFSTELPQCINFAALYKQNLLVLKNRLLLLPKPVDSDEKFCAAITKAFEVLEQKAELLGDKLVRVLDDAQISQEEKNKYIGRHIFRDHKIISEDRFNDLFRQSFSNKKQLDTLIFLLLLSHLTDSK